MYTVQDIDLDNYGNLIEPANDKIALIDADTLVFTSCLNAEYEDEDVEGNVEHKTDMALAIKNAEEKLKKIFNKTGCRDAELHFSVGKNNFRYKIYPEYKANRKDLRIPQGLYELKLGLLKLYDGIMHEDIEADDYVVYKKMHDYDKYILCAVDKDVLNSIAGTHFNYYESGHYSIDMKWYEVSEAKARMWPYIQCIIGDKTDNIPGCKGIGPKRVQKFINENMTEKELWEGVISAFSSVGKTESDALLTMNLVNMRLYNGTQIEAWSPNV